MKTLFITDTHLGCRQGSRIFREYFRWWYKDILFKYIKENNIDMVIHLGDFFDNRNHVTVDDIQYVLNEFIPQFDELKVPMYIVMGNHDVAYRNTNDTTSLSLFNHSKNIEVVDDVKEIDLGNLSYCIVPWVNSENYNESVKFISEKANNDTILIGHFEIKQMKMYAKGAVCEHGFEPSLFKDFRKVLSGHFHHNSTYQNIEYIGSAFHLTWQDYNDWRGFTVHDTETDTYEKIENEYCLFEELVYSKELLDKDQDDLQELVENKFVKLVINTEYKKLELKDLVSRIENCRPVKLQIDDQYVLTSVTIDDESVEEVKVSGDVYEYLDKGIQESDIKTLAKDVFDKAYNEMSKGE